MGFFSSKPPNTISDKDMAALRRRGEKTNSDWFSKRSVDRRLASNKQRDKRKQS